MAEYIEREAVLALQHRLYHSPLSAMIELSPTYIISPDAVQRIPAADVVPVVRAENLGKDYAECDQFVCSKCGIELQDWHRVERNEDDGEETYHEYVFRFCPNCGARMDMVTDCNQVKERFL